MPWSIVYIPERKDNVYCSYTKPRLLALRVGWELGVFVGTLGIGGNAGTE